MDAPVYSVEYTHSVLYTKIRYLRVNCIHRPNVQLHKYTVLTQGDIMGGGGAL